MLSLGALGVVYGDVGTNPLFAMRECFGGHHGLPLTPANILGSVSLAVWALLLVICLKYTVFVLRADNEGEGGALALLAKIPPRLRSGLQTRPFLLVVVLLFGAALLLGDGVVTPAIGVLAAVEGLGVTQDRVITYTVAILVVLFLIQRFGTGRVGVVFGPVMLLWFVVLGLLGVVQIIRQPGILAALDPRNAIELLRSGQPGSYLVLGAIILCVGGGEALYADLGHFGRRPIVRAWYRVVFPALMLVYLGQGALLLRSPAAIENPFFQMAPGILRYPLVALATAATVIASQALISGSFSLARQAVNLGFFPHLTIRHTSKEETGQIYVPIVNTVLMFGCVALVIGFGSSSKLAAAYGLATNGTMTATTIGFFFVMWRVWRVNLFLSLLVSGTFLTIDGAFLGANLAKLLDGGWVPLCLATVFLSLAMIWRWGRRGDRRGPGDAHHPHRRVPGRERRERRLPPARHGRISRPADRRRASHRHAPSRTQWRAPQAAGLAVHRDARRALRRAQPPADGDRSRPRLLPGHRAGFGYEERPNVPVLLEACAIHGLVVDFEQVTYVIVRDALRLGACTAHSASRGVFSRSFRAIRRRRSGISACPSNA